MPRKPHYIPGKHKIPIPHSKLWIDSESENSSCWKCEHLAYCRSILWTMQPLPCYEGYKVPHASEKTTETVKICKQCGVEFTANHRSRKYCSDKCKVRAFREREKV